MKNKFEIRDVDVGSIDESGFFCYMSKRKEPGYKQKREWLEARFAEGMKIKILHENGGRDVAFIEYIPGEYAWRAVNAPGYMVIHCLWVVGKGRGKGYGSRLIKECVDDARTQKKRGVVMITTNRVWMARKDIFANNGFTEMDQAPPSFQLMGIRFGAGPEVCFPENWDDRARRFGPGLTVIRTPQCPYIENGTKDVLAFAKGRGMRTQVVEFKTAQEVQERSPSAYGVFGIVLDGSFFAYHYLLQKDFDKLMLERNKGE
jgi:GNAT superfamily N-acetyltransferase